MTRLPRPATALLLLLQLGLLPVLACAAASGQTAADATTAAPEFTVVTLNLFHDSDDWPRRRVQIVETLRRLKPDAIALQEVLQDEGLPNQAVWLARELGYETHFVTTDPPSHRRRYGNALLTRETALEDGVTLLHPLEDHRVAGYVRLLAGGHAVNVYVVHLYWAPDGGATRARQLADLLAYVDATAAGAPSVLAGDFNADAGAPELRALRAHWADADASLHPDAGATASSTLNPHYFDAPASVDHVFVERGRILPVETALLFTAPDADGVWASDHRGLLARLRVDTRASP